MANNADSTDSVKLRCTCGRERVPDHVFPSPPDPPIYLIHRHTDCPAHGDGSDYWRDTQEFAKNLAAELGLAP